MMHTVALSFFLHMFITASKMTYPNVLERPPVAPSPQTETENTLLIIEGNHYVLIYSVHLKNKTLICTLHISLMKTAKYFVLIESNLCIHPLRPNK